MVRHQPSKLIFVGSNPISRSVSVISNQLPVVPFWLTDYWSLFTETGARGAAVSAGDS